jgi:hypothetical protein
VMINFPVCRVWRVIPSLQTKVGKGRPQKRVHGVRYNQDRKERMRDKLSALQAARKKMGDVHHGQLRPQEFF